MSKDTILGVLGLVLIIALFSFAIVTAFLDYRTRFEFIAAGYSQCRDTDSTVVTWRKSCLNY